MKLSYSPFTITIIPALCVTMAFLLLCSLSLWQLQRGVEKQALEKTHSHQAQLDALSIVDLPSILKKPYLYQNRIIKLSGYFQNHHTIFLDNKIHSGQVGYYVITPFLIDHNKSILINRGWIARGASRAILPVIEPILDEKTTITGKISLPHKNRFIKNKLETHQSYFRIQEIDFALLKPVFKSTLEPLLIALSSDSVFSFEALPQEATWLNPKKHFAYALQWLLLALSLVIIYTIVCRTKNKSP